MPSPGPDSRNRSGVGRRRLAGSRSRRRCSERDGGAGASAHALRRPARHRALDDSHSQHCRLGGADHDDGSGRGCGLHRAVGDSCQLRGEGGGAARIRQARNRQRRDHAPRVQPPAGAAAARSVRSRRRLAGGEAAPASPDGRHRRGGRPRNEHRPPLGPACGLGLDVRTGGVPARLARQLRIHRACTAVAPDRSLFARHHVLRRESAMDAVPHRGTP